MPVIFCIAINKKYLKKFEKTSVFLEQFIV